MPTTYESASEIRGIAPDYNCHSYAWHSTSSSNPYWINDPSVYILDGSYSRVYNYYAGDKILYGTPGSEPEHSAIIAEVADSKHLTYVKSKWGAAGVFEHLYYDCPYTSSIKAYT